MTVFSDYSSWSSASLGMLCDRLECLSSSPSWVYSENSFLLEPKNPDYTSAFGFRTVRIFWAPSGKNFQTNPAFGGKNVTNPPKSIIANTWTPLPHSCSKYGSNEDSPVESNKLVIYKSNIYFQLSKFKRVNTSQLSPSLFWYLSILTCPVTMLEYLSDIGDNLILPAAILVWAECIRCHWALEAELSGHY